MKSSQQLFGAAPYHRRISSLDADQLISIDDWLQELLDNDSPALTKTHYFHGRWENLYVDEQHPALQRLMAESLEFCADMLGTTPDALKLGFWFNRMEPGQVTTLHRHDDFDELISGVVYLKVPPRSGDLVLVVDNDELALQPVSGNFIYFSPETPHKVNENLSDSRRLSIGMNIGPRHDRD